MTMTKSRGEATAAAIEGAALDLALERGYEGVTVDMICQKAGVSQRTFFNHFPTKDDALLGREAPSVDETAARRFLISTGPLLLDAVSLITLPDGDTATRMNQRMDVITGSPSLLSAQMQRIAAIESELHEIIRLRLAHQDPNLPESDVHRQATMVTHLVAGVMRSIAFLSRHRDAGDQPIAAYVQQARTTLEQVLRESTITSTPQ